MEVGGRRIVGRGRLQWAGASARRRRRVGSTATAPPTSRQQHRGGPVDGRPDRPTQDRVLCWLVRCRSVEGGRAAVAAAAGGRCRGNRSIAPSHAPARPHGSPCQPALSPSLPPASPTSVPAPPVPPSHSPASQPHYPIAQHARSHPVGRRPPAGPRHRRPLAQPPRQPVRGRDDVHGRAHRHDPARHLLWQEAHARTPGRLSGRVRVRLVLLLSAAQATSS